MVAALTKWVGIILGLVLWVDLRVSAEGPQKWFAIIIGSLCILVLSAGFVLLPRMQRPEDADEIKVLRHRLEVAEAMLSGGGMPSRQP